MSCKSKGAFPSNQRQSSEVWRLWSVSNPKRGQTGFNWTTGTRSLPLNQTFEKKMEKSLVLKYYFRKNWRERNTLLYKSTELNGGKTAGHIGSWGATWARTCQAAVVPVVVPPATCRHGGQHNTKASVMRGLKSQGDSLPVLSGRKLPKTRQSCQKIGNFTSVFHSSRKHVAVCLLFNPAFVFQCQWFISILIDCPVQQPDTQSTRKTLILFYSKKLGFLTFNLKQLLSV